MQLPDVNVLVDSYRGDAAGHAEASRWLRALLDGDESYGLSDLACSGFLRIVTHPKIFDPPSTTDDALIFLDQIRTHVNCVILSPGARHWGIFTELCRANDVRGKLVPDAYFAALAIESGSEWITFDGDYARFPGLRWRRPSV